MRRLGIVLVAVLALSGCNDRYGWGADIPVRGDRSTAPVDIGGGKAWRAVDAGEITSCGIDAAQRLSCKMFAGIQEVAGPTPTPAWTSVSTGLEHRCAIWDGGSLYCWGSNSLGELGTGGASGYEPTPQQVGSASDWKVVAAGHHNTCGVRGAGDLYCWGAGIIVGGVVGDGTTEQRSTPTRIGTASDWTSVDLTFRTCGLRGSGQLWCWGYGVGDGTTELRLSPVRIGSASDWGTISVGRFHTCGLRSQDLYCWGSNDYGQVGDGTSTTRLAPVRVGTDSDWRSISAGGTEQVAGSGGGNEYLTAHTCGIRESGALWCWGMNQRGEVGDGTTTTRLAPVRIGTGSDWEQVSAGGDYTEALRARP